MSQALYITTTLPYVNADPHIGFALEIVQADTYARFMKLLGYEILFNTGTDEHGKKIYEKAVSEHKDPKKYCDEYAVKFGLLKQALNLSYTHFIRTTDSSHEQAAQEFWKRCEAKGDIYKKMYKVKYCVGCELEKTDSELVDGKCPLHPNKILDTYEETNYFFRFSKYQEKLLDLYASRPDFIKPSHRLREIREFVSKGLEDFSISRVKEKMPWGIDVPGDSTQVMYVWFDALINYISTLGWPSNTDQFSNYWPGIQVAGKDNLRQQSAMWQAMLFSAGLAPSKEIFIHGFITSNGKKMSKSLGNVVNPIDLSDQYGTDPLRYYLLREIPSLDDGDFSEERFRELYESDLANELGNLVSRLTTLAEKNKVTVQSQKFSPAIFDPYRELIQNFQFTLALEKIWNEIKYLNTAIDKASPWHLQHEDAAKFLISHIPKLQRIGQLLMPFLPETSLQITNLLSGNIVKSKPLFPRLVNK